MNSRNLKKNKGFTLVELLCAIVILGVVSAMSIKGISGLINKAKEAEDDQIGKTLSMAAESYIQANPKYKPKTIGESKNIPVSDLKNANYIKEDLKKSTGEDCMAKSYVRVYKLSKTEYTYLPLLICGNEEAPAVQEEIKPTIQIFFTNAKGETFNGEMDDLENARIRIIIEGGTGSDGPLSIDGYSYTISANDQVVFDSGSLSANRQTKIDIVKDLKPYVSKKGTTNMVVNASARNIYGYLNEVVGGTENQGTTATYNDSKAPLCISIENEARPDDWINKKSSRERIITVNCDDGNGSGCIRDSFTKTWPQQEMKSVEYAYIQATDNNGNKAVEDSNVKKTFLTKDVANFTEEQKNCLVRVNVDLEAPTINLKAYKRTERGLKGEEVLSEKIASDKTTDNEVKSTDYSVLNNGWMNAFNYPYGIIYEAEISDTIGLKKVSWQVNNSGIKNKNTTEYNNIVQTAETYDRSYETSAPNTLEDTFNFVFTLDGVRRGKLLVEDIAGNITMFQISADLDRSIPPVPEYDIYRYIEKTNPNIRPDFMYENNTWSNTPFVVMIKDQYHPEEGEILKYDYQIKTEDINSYSSNISEIPRFDAYDPDNTTKYDGKNKIRVITCDEAENCSNVRETPVKDVWIDTVDPICSVESYKGNTTTEYNGATSGYNGWVGIGGTGDKRVDYVRVQATCNDASAANGKTSSGCTNTTDSPSSFSTNYNTHMDISNAGARGQGAGGVVKDNAGNTTNCSANKTVRIDTSAPTCKVTAKTGTNYANNYTGGWLKKDESAKIIAECNTDTGSGCNNSVKPSKVYNTNINTTTAGAAGNNAGGTVEDNVGNKTTCNADKTVKVDVDPPTCTIAGKNKSNTAYSGGWVKADAVPITLTATCSDTGGSNCKTSTATESYNSNMNTTKTLKVTDNAGNEGTCTSDFAVSIDTSAPSCNGQNPTRSDYTFDQSIVINAKCKDGTGQSGCSKTETPKTFSLTDSVTKIDTGKITITDKAGNSTECTVNVKLQKRTENICQILKSNDKTAFGTARGSLTLDKNAFNEQAKNNLNSNLYRKSSDGKTLYNSFAAAIDATSWGPDKWCFADGYTNGCYNGMTTATKGAKTCYLRVCSDKTLCAEYYGWSTDQINAAAGCSLARCWCSCTNPNF